MFDGGMVAAKSNDDGVFSLSAGGGWIFVKNKRGGVDLNTPEGTVYVTDKEDMRHQVMVNKTER